MAVFKLVDLERQKYLSSDNELMILMESGEIGGIRVTKQFVLRDRRGFYQDRDKVLQTLLDRNSHTLET